jgi:hypothetical protein
LVKQQLNLCLFSCVEKPSCAFAPIYTVIFVQPMRRFDTTKMRKFFQASRVEKRTKLVIQTFCNIKVTIRIRTRHDLIVSKVAQRLASAKEEEKLSPASMS